MEKIRLQKFFADSGIMSRRKCESAISAGRIKINGETASLGDRVDPEKDEVCLDDSPISFPTVPPVFTPWDGSICIRKVFSL